MPETASDGRARAIDMARRPVPRADAAIDMARRPGPRADAPIDMALAPAPLQTRPSMRRAFLVLGLLSACNAPADAPAASRDSATPPAVSPGASATARAATDSPSSLAGQKFGEPITEATETSLDDIVSDPGKYKDRSLRTTGTVTAVCQHMGCWMEIGDEAKRAHIRMAGHSFFVPKTASGHRAIVQGRLTGADPLGGECNHEGADSCGGEANGVVAKLEIEAVGVEFVD
jgi:hypothetical protein